MQSTERGSLLRITVGEQADTSDNILSLKDDSQDERSEDRDLTERAEHYKRRSELSISSKCIRRHILAEDDDRTATIQVKKEKDQQDPQHRAKIGDIFFATREDAQCNKPPQPPGLYTPNISSSTWTGLFYDANKLPVTRQFSYDKQRNRGTSTSSFFPLVFTKRFCNTINCCESLIPSI